MGMVFCSLPSQSEDYTNVSIILFLDTDDSKQSHKSKRRLSSNGSSEITSKKSRIESDGGSGEG